MKTKIIILSTNDIFINLPLLNMISNDEKIDKTINNIKMKQTSVLTEWEKLHPNYPNEPVLLDEWQKMLSNVTEDPNNSQPSKIKIALKRNIANHTQLKEAMEKK